jgi:hypothetical protein
MRTTPRTIIAPPGLVAVAARCLLAATLAIAATGCSFDRSDADARSARASALVGAWDARFQRTDPVPGRPAGAPPIAVHGVLAFVPGRRGEGVDELPDPTNAGTFDVDFAPMGFDPREPSSVPPALARAAGPDSVAILLGTGGERPGVAMLGAWSGDSIVGRWSLVSTRTLGASGRFVLTRRQGA